MIAHSYFSVFYLDNSRTTSTSPRNSPVKKIRKVANSDARVISSPGSSSEGNLIF